ncbi:DUF2624 family protein [Jeotgalibacillus campisalis]|uniref:tRNA methyltransferase n=1 Tax=Jeotgalibacillus campisalis TaxID=220754 RepID=A0A0C2RW99_9BACL|nr:DUF2624 family protein [Jeotgalibacillus campisalis]KIL46014.1 hypothetical protein KR50_26890 [Jeotgalibacillus campisalis]
MKWLQTFVNTKLHQLSAEELRRYAAPFDLKLTNRESEILARLLKQDKIDFFNEKERALLFKRVEGVIGTARARKLETIVQTFLQENKL